MIFASHTGRRISNASILATLQEMVDRLPPGAAPFKTDDQLTWESLQEHRAEEDKHGERVSDWTCDRMYGGAA